MAFSSERKADVLAVLRKFGGIYGMTAKQVADTIWLDDNCVLDGRSVTPYLLALEREGKSQRLREGRLRCWRARGLHTVHQP